MTKRKNLTKKKKEKIFEIIVGILAFIALFLLVICGIVGIKTKDDSKIWPFLAYGIIYIPLVFCILPYAFFKDEMPSGGAKNVVKGKLKFDSFENLEKDFILKLKDRNIEVGNFKNDDYKCTFGLYNNKSYAIGEELIYLKNPTKKKYKKL